MAELDIGRKTAGDQVEERTTIPPVTRATRRKARVTRKAKEKSKHVFVVETNQPSETASTVSYPSQTPSLIGELSCNSNVEPWIMGVTINSVSTRRQAGAEYLLLDSGAHLHACPIKYPRRKVPLPDPGIHTASGGRRTSGDIQTSRSTEQFECFSTRLQFRNQFCLLVVSLSRGTGVIFVQTLVHCSFLTRPRYNTAKQSCTRKRVCSLSKGCWLRPCRQQV